MRLLASILLLIILNTTVFSQTLYTRLNHTNYRSYPAFKQTINIDSIDIELLNACIFFATNEIRAKKKLNILSYNRALEEAAIIHSRDMARLNFFSHTNKKLKSRKEPEDRAREVGISNPHIAENIIEGFIIKYKSGMDVIAGDPGVFVNPKTDKTLETNSYLSLTDNIMEQWMNSEGHRKNILSKDALELGCGVALYYMENFNKMPAIKATQNFQWFETVVIR